MVADDRVEMETNMGLWVSCKSQTGKTMSHPGCVMEASKAKSMPTWNLGVLYQAEEMNYSDLDTWIALGDAQGKVDFLALTQTSGGSFFQMVHSSLDLTLAHTMKSQTSFGILRREELQGLGRREW